MAKTHAKRLHGIIVLIALCVTWWLKPAFKANAATNSKQRVTQPAKKPEAKKPEAKKPEAKKSDTKKEAAKPAAKKEAKPARQASGKEASGKKASARKTAQRKTKPVRHAAKPKRGAKETEDDD